MQINEITIGKEYWSLRLHRVVTVLKIDYTIITVEDSSGQTVKTTAKTLIEIGG